jgi:hypothetical protein
LSLSGIVVVYIRPLIACRERNVTGHIQRRSGCGDTTEKNERHQSHRNISQCVGEVCQEVDDCLPKIVGTAQTVPGNLVTVYPIGRWDNETKVEVRSWSAVLLILVKYADFGSWLHGKVTTAKEQGISVESVSARNAYTDPKKAKGQPENQPNRF